MPKIEIKAIDRLFWLLLLLASACNESPNDQYAYYREGLPDSLLPLYNEILAVHDEVMPEMTTLSSYQNNIAEEIRLLKSDTSNRDKVRHLNQILGNLNRAEDAMMTWMHHFSRIDSIPDSEKGMFLENERISVTGMRDLIFRSLQSSKNYLDNE